LIKVNCGTMPAELFEREFFGYARGTFTGALRDHAGRFELADKGTLFLDEVGEIPLDMQSKLVEVLQEGKCARLGEERKRPVDLRVVATTNRDLEQEVEAGRLRRDLHEQINVFPIALAPVRRLGEDISVLAGHYLQQAAETLKRPCPELTEAGERQLLAYDWPGNVRELQSIVERAVITYRSGPLVFDLPAVTVEEEPDPNAPVSPTQAGGVMARLKRLLGKTT
jgi:transcriptional regulator with GAF, ATPase, and Fis domain